jgi:acyl dehydratase
MQEYHQEIFTISKNEMLEFARISGDHNPIHLDEKYALSQGFPDTIVYGALVISKVSGIIASKFPGPGTVIGSINWRFISPIYVSQIVTVKLKLRIGENRKRFLDLKLVNVTGELVQEAKLIVFIGK